MSLTLQILHKNRYLHTLTPQYTQHKALFATLGCKLNFAETSTVARLLAERGVCRVAPGETPDLCVVNTCSVTGEADKKCRRVIRSLATKYPSAAIIVTGRSSGDRRRRSGGRRKLEIADCRLCGKLAVRTLSSARCGQSD